MLHRMPRANHAFALPALWPFGFLCLLSLSCCAPRGFARCAGGADCSIGRSTDRFHFPCPRCAELISGGRCFQVTPYLDPMASFDQFHPHSSPAGGVRAAAVWNSRELESRGTAKDHAAWHKTEYASANAFKSSRVWQDECWARWPTDAAWPQVLDMYEAAARLRVSPDSLRRATKTDRDGKARLAHQRIGSVYRFRSRDIDAFGQVHGR
jgi:hypothetical protein